MSRTGGDRDTPGSTSPRRAARSAPASRHRSRRAKILGWTSIAVVAVLVAAALVGYLQFRSVYDRIGHVAVTGLGNRPPKYTNAVNILVFGSDRRAGLTRRQQIALHVGTNQGEDNTDSIMLLHISPGRGKATLLSIPRDTMVPMYACHGGHGHPGQHANPAARVQVNSLFAVGGAACLWKTVEHQTGIRIDHFIELGFTGFVHAINDLGGVNVCLPFTVHDPESGLKLTKGPHHIDGITALKFWRTRYSIGTGTDLQRIQRDQYLLAQVLHGVLQRGLLSNPLRLVRVTKDVAGSLTTDSGMSQTDLLHLALSLSHI
ncbi:MAG: LCP family protein, partial [Actinobacteria bacterium]|nr:LCP family protein [Actinomycetota bacterium]